MKISVQDLREIARATADKIEEITDEIIDESALEAVLRRYDIEVE